MRISDWSSDVCSSDLEARRSSDTLIVARTDARTTLGLDEALRRAEAYRKAGADIIFVESPESEEELERIGRTIDAPLLANMVQAGRTPVVPAETLKGWGFNLAKIGRASCRERGCQYV